MIPPSDVFEKLDEKKAKRFEGGEEMIVNSSSSDESDPLGESAGESLGDLADMFLSFIRLV